MKERKMMREQESFKKKMDDIDSQNNMDSLGMDDMDMRSRGSVENRISDNMEMKDVDDTRAEMNGKVGHFETEHTEPTGEGSSIPGAEENRKIISEATGAGIGGNAGRGTASKKKLD